MKSIACWEDLNEFGIVPLTGEACGLMYRILCDVTPLRRDRPREEDGGEGARPARGQAPRKLESGLGGRPPHNGSVMLGPELLSFLGVFALLEAGCRET